MQSKYQLYKQYLRKQNIPNLIEDQKRSLKHVLNMPIMNNGHNNKWEFYIKSENLPNDPSELNHEELLHIKNKAEKCLDRVINMEDRVEDEARNHEIRELNSYINAIGKLVKISQTIDELMDEKYKIETEIDQDYDSKEVFSVLDFYSEEMDRLRRSFFKKKQKFKNAKKEYKGFKAAERFVLDKVRAYDNALLSGEVDTENAKKISWKNSVLTEVLEEISQVMPDIERTYTDIKGEYDPVVEEYTQNALALALEKGNKLREMGVMNKGQYLLYLATKDDVGLIEDIKKGLYNKYDKMAKAKNYPEGITSFKNIIEDFLYNTVFEVYESYPYEINDEFSKEMENELRDYADMRYNMVFDVVMKMVNGSHNPFIEDLSDKQYENLAYMLLDGIINKKKKNKIVMGLGGTDDKDIMPRLLAYPEMAYLLMDAVEEVNEDYKYKYHEIDLDLVPQISQFELNIKNAYELSSKVNKLDSEKAKYNAEKMTLLLAMQAKKRGYADNVVFHAVDVSEIEKSEAFQTAKAGLWEVLKLCYLEYDYRSENEKTDLEMTMKFYKELAAYYPKKYMKGKHINLDAIDFDLAKEISVLQQRAKHHGEGISDEEALCRVIEYVAAHPVIFEDIKDNLNENSFEIGGHGENAFRFMQNAIVSMLKANEYDLNMGNQYKGKNVLGHLSTKAGGKPTPYYNARNYSGYPDDENKQDFYLYELKEGISQFGNEKVEKYIIKSMKPDKERPSPVEDLQLLAKSKGYGGGSTKKQMKLRSVLDLVNDISFNIEYMDKLRLYVDFDLLNIKVQTANEVLDLVGHKANIYGNNEEIISGDTLSQDVVNHAREVDEREGQYE